MVSSDFDLGGNWLDLLELNIYFLHHTSQLWTYLDPFLFLTPRSEKHQISFQKMCFSLAVWTRLNSFWKCVSNKFCELCGTVGDTNKEMVSCCNWKIVRHIVNWIIYTIFKYISYIIMYIIYNIYIYIIYYIIYIYIKYNSVFYIKPNINIQIYMCITHHIW